MADHVPALQVLQLRELVAPAALDHVPALHDLH